MVRLADIPDNVLKEIEKFVKEMKGKYPVVSNDPEKSLVTLVERKFGYRLSPQQIYTLQRGERRVSIKVDVEAIKELEEMFGSVSKGIKEVLKLYKSAKLPDHLKPYHRKLLEKGEVSPDEIPQILGVDDKKAWKIMGELCSLGYAMRVKDKFKIFRIPVDPVLMYFMGGV